MPLYWILDKEDTPQGYPLQKLVRQIRRAIGENKCQFSIVRSDGYGGTINKWNEQLDIKERILIDPDHLDRLSEGVDEWFYNLDAICTTRDQTIRFGIHDSSALFLDALPSSAILILANFNNVQAERRNL